MFWRKALPYILVALIAVSLLWVILQNASSEALAGVVVGTGLSVLASIATESIKANHEREAAEALRNREIAKARQEAQKLLEQSLLQAYTESLRHLLWLSVVPDAGMSETYSHTDAAVQGMSSLLILNPGDTTRETSFRKELHSFVLGWHIRKGGRESKTQTEDMRQAVWDLWTSDPRIERVEP